MGCITYDPFTFFIDIIVWLFMTKVIPYNFTQLYYAVQVYGVVERFEVLNTWFMLKMKNYYFDFFDFSFIIRLII